MKTTFRLGVDGWYAAFPDDDAPLRLPAEVLVLGSAVAATAAAEPPPGAEWVPPLDPVPDRGGAITPDFFPADELVPQQWHLLAMGDLERIWDEFTGAGIKVGIYDDGVQYTHHDLNDNYDASNHVVIGPTTFDGINTSGADGHGTAVAGLIAGENDGVGTVGVAFGAHITGVNIFDPASALFINAGVPTAFYNAIAQSSRYDVVNNSWGSVPSYDAFQNLNTGSFSAQTVAGWNSAAAGGRGGLGTIVVKSSGNDDKDANGDGANAAQVTITVSAIGDSGFAASYSNYGASILVGAPGSEFDFNGGLGITSTDLLGTDGYNTRAAPGSANDYTDDFGGTSAAGPIVAGVTALMLDANAGLGWRDVQNILAASAHHTGSAYGATAPGSFEDGVWQFNKANTWNGGGMHVHSNYGYGAIDAYAAVRMAEVWTLFGAAATTTNQVNLTSTFGGLPLNLVDNGLFTYAVGTPFIETGVEAEYLSVRLNITHADWTQLRISIVSPEGTEIKLTDGKAGNSATSDSPLNWSFGIESLRGENFNGSWTLKINDVVAGQTGTLNGWAITFSGQAPTTNDVFHFTDEFSELSALAGQSSRRTISDLDGGTDWINAAAVTSGSVINLNANTYSRIDGTLVKIIGANAIENAVSGDGNDVLIGNDADNTLYGMRGADTMRGGLGSDLYGVDNAGDVVTEATGQGSDTVRASVSYALGAGNEVEVIETADAMGVAAINLTGNEVSQALNGNDGGNLLQGLDGYDEIHGLGGNDTLDGGEFYDDIYGGEGNDLLIGGGTGVIAGLDDLLDGGNGDDTLIGGTNGDSLDGGGGSRDLASYAGSSGVRVALDGSVTFTGDAAGDTLIRIEDLLGSSFSDTLVGDAGANQVTGGDGDDSLLGQAGNDTLSGGAGIDTLDGGNDNDVLLVGGADAISDVIRGGSGNDRLQVIAGSGPLTLNALSSVSGIETLDGAGEIIQGTGGANRLDFSIFAAVVNVAAINALSGNDTVIGSGGNDTIDGGWGNDSIRAGNGNDVVLIGSNEALYDMLLDGGGGALDTLKVRAGSGLVTLTTTQNITGFETFDGSGEVVQGTSTADFLNFSIFGTVLNIASIVTYEGNDTVVGSGGADVIDGRGGNDSILAGNGDDVVLIGTSEALADTLDGGGGTLDTLQVRAGSGALTLTSLQKFTGFEIFDGSGEIVQGTSSADLLNFSTFNSVVNVASIIAYEGNDTVVGSGGADTIDGRGGNDSMLGGNGDDWFLIGSTEAVGDTINGGIGTDHLQVRAGSGLLTLSTTQNFSQIEVFDGAGSVVQGTTGADFLNFSIFSTVSNVAAINTYQGNDTIIGSGGGDTINGGGGTDSITGGGGNDSLTGGADADRFVFTSASQGTDIITDFTVLVDDFVISAAGFGGGLFAGADLAALGRFVSNTTGLATSAFGQFIEETDIGRLWWDVDGTGGTVAVAIADLLGIAGQTLGAGDFIIIA